jgi:hypothetical protein
MAVDSNKLIRGHHPERGRLGGDRNGLLGNGFSLLTCGFGLCQPLLRKAADRAQDDNQS